MPPKGVSMSTFLSLSSAFFLTFTLHAASKTRLKQAAASSELVHRALELDMIGTSASCQRLPLDAAPRCAMLGIVTGRSSRSAISAKRDFTALISETVALEKVQM